MPVIKLLTTTKLAEALNTHPATVLRLAREGRIPRMQLGRHGYRYNLDEVLEALKVDVDANNALTEEQ